MDLIQMGTVISSNFYKMNKIGTVISSNFDKMTNKGLVEQVREFGFLGRVKQCIHLNNEYLKGFNDSIAYLNRFQDLKSYELSTMDYLDKLVSKESKTFNCLPDQHFLKSLLRDNTNLYYQIKCKYYNPKTKRMVDFIPNTELDPIISYNYYYLREMLGLKNLTPMRYAELSQQRKLWHVFNRASEDLHESLRNKLTQFEQITDKISHKMTQCLVHVVTCQSHDGISYVYGNIFALVKFGFFTTVWFNFTECDPSICSGDMVPDNFLELFFKDKSYVPGYSKLVFMETKKYMTPLVVEAFGDTPFKEMIDSMQKLDLHEWETLPDNDEIIGSIRENKNMMDSKWQVSIGLGILVCFCLSIGVLPDWNNIL